jgi:hypothetical protein
MAHVRRHRPLRALTPCALLAALTAGCVTTPNSGSPFSPHESIEFAGLVSEPDEFVYVQARRKDNGRWVTVGEFLPELDAHYGGGEDWYEFQGGVQLDLRPEWRCFFTSNCTTPWGTLTAEFRVRQDHGDPRQLYTRTVEQAACMQPLILEIGLEDAYDACGERRTTSTLYWDNRPSLPDTPLVRSW